MDFGLASNTQTNAIGVCSMDFGLYVQPGSTLEPSRGRVGPSRAPILKYNYFPAEAQPGKGPGKPPPQPN